MIILPYNKTKKILCTSSIIGTYFRRIIYLLKIILSLNINMKSHLIIYKSQVIIQRLFGRIIII